MPCNVIMHLPDVRKPLQNYTIYLMNCNIASAFSPIAISYFLLYTEHMKKSYLIISILLNAYIVVSLLICLLRFLLATGEGNMQVHGAMAFQYFTVDSNALMAIASIFLVYHQIRMLKDPSRQFPHWLELFHYIAVASVSVTFITVCVILLPATSLEMMFGGNNLLLHLINPIVAIVSFMFFTVYYRSTWKQTLLAISTTLLYGILYFIMGVAISKENG